MDNTLTREQRSEAYAVIKEHFGLKAKQRTKLDDSPLYLAILTAAHEGSMTDAGRLLQAAGIIA